MKLAIVIFTALENIIKDIPLRRLQSQVSDHHLAEIAQDLVEWEQISPALKLTDSECREIKEDFSDRYNLQKRQALRVWRWKSGNQATYKNLIQLFYSQGLVQLAETLAKAKLCRFLVSCHPPASFLGYRIYNYY